MKCFVTYVGPYTYTFDLIYLCNVFLHLCEHTGHFNFYLCHLWPKILTYKETKHFAEFGAFDLKNIFLTYMTYTCTSDIYSVGLSFWKTHEKLHYQSLNIWLWWIVYKLNGPFILHILILQPYLFRFFFLKTHEMLRYPSCTIYIYIRSQILM